LSGLGYQGISVGRAGPDSTIENALSNVSAFGLKLAEAKGIVKEVGNAVDDWRGHFQACGVSVEDPDTLAPYVNPLRGR